MEITITDTDDRTPWRNYREDMKQARADGTDMVEYKFTELRRSDEKGITTVVLEGDEEVLLVWDDSAPSVQVATPDGVRLLRAVARHKEMTGTHEAADIVAACNRDDGVKVLTIALKEMNNGRSAWLWTVEAA